jgi:hypothetical protein
MQYAAAPNAFTTSPAMPSAGPILMNDKIFSIPGVHIGTVGLAYTLLALASSVAAYGLLALIVHRTSHRARR